MNPQRRSLMAAAAAHAMAGCAVAPPDPPKPPQRGPEPAPRPAPLSPEPDRYMQQFNRDLIAFMGNGPTARRMALIVDASPNLVESSRYKLDMPIELSLTLLSLTSNLGENLAIIHGDNMQPAGAPGQDGRPAGGGQPARPSVARLRVAITFADPKRQDGEKSRNGSLFGRAADGSGSEAGTYQKSSLVIAASAIDANGQAGRGLTSEARAEWLSSSSSTRTFGVSVMSAAFGNAQVRREYTGPHEAVRAALAFTTVHALSGLTEVIPGPWAQEAGLKPNTAPVERSTVRWRNELAGNAKPKAALEMNFKRALLNGGVWPDDRIDMGPQWAFKRRADGLWMPPDLARDAKPFRQHELVTQLEKRGFFLTPQELEHAALHAAQRGATLTHRDAMRRIQLRAEQSA